MQDQEVGGIVLVVLSTISYLLFADTFRAYISDYTTNDKVVLMGVVLAVLYVAYQVMGDDA